MDADSVWPMSKVKWLAALVMATGYQTMSSRVDVILTRCFSHSCSRPTVSKSCLRQPAVHRKHAWNKLSHVAVGVVVFYRKWLACPPHLPLGCVRMVFCYPWAKLVKSSVVSNISPRNSNFLPEALPSKGTFGSVEIFFPPYGRQVACAFQYFSKEPFVWEFLKANHPNPFKSKSPWAPWILLFLQKEVNSLHPRI